MAQLEIGARPGEELGVLGVGSRPAALDEADAERVEVAGDRQLVGDGQRHPLALGAVAQRRVVDVEGVGGHLFSRCVLDKAKDPSRMREVCARTVVRGGRRAYVMITMLYMTATTVPRLSRW